MMHRLIIACEQSSDLYGQEIVKALRHQHPDDHIAAIGGNALKECSDTFLINVTQANAVGFTEHHRHKETHKRMYATLDHYLQTTPVDQVIIMDCSHYNFKLAAIIKRYNCPIVTVITPNFWRWNATKHMKKLADYSEKIITIFEKEHHAYKPFHQNVVYVGNPIIAMSAIHKRDHFPEMKPPTDTYTIGLCPGSREFEIRLLLPKMIKSYQCLQRDMSVKGTVVVADARFLGLIETLMANYKGDGITISDEGKETTLAACDGVISCAGTGTLEMVLRHIPQVVIGKLSWVSYVIARWIVNINITYCALGNMIIGRIAIPEYIQYLDPKQIAGSLKELLQDQTRRDDLDKAYKEIKEKLGQGHIFEKIAAEL